MEAVVATTTTRVPFPLLPTAGRPLLPLGLARPRCVFASVAATSTSGAGGGGGRSSAGGRGGDGGGDDSGAGAVAAAAAVAALGEAEQQEDSDSDAIVLHVGGMTCGGCADKVKRILESQPEVAAATVDVEKATAIVWTTPEAKATKDWQKQLAEKLANHLTSCGFQSHLQDEGEAEQTDA